VAEASELLKQWRSENKLTYKEAARFFCDHGFDLYFQKLQVWETGIQHPSKSKTQRLEAFLAKHPKVNLTPPDSNPKPHRDYEDATPSPISDCGTDREEALLSQEMLIMRQAGCTIAEIAREHQLPVFTVARLVGEVSPDLESPLPAKPRTDYGTPRQGWDHSAPALPEEPALSQSELLANLAAKLTSMRYSCETYGDWAKRCPEAAAKATKAGAATVNEEKPAEQLKPNQESGWNGEIGCIPPMRPNRQQRDAYQNRTTTTFGEANIGGCPSGFLLQRDDLYFGY
jgi:hypothetical protein